MTSTILQKEEMARIIRAYHQKGWSPATSTNYSFRNEGQIWVSRSGVDKANFTAADFMTVDADGKPMGDYKETKPSAETLIHTTLYQLFEDTKVILHAHSVYPVLLSTKCEAAVTFSGFEVQKAFPEQKTHDASVEIPVFDNTQDMSAFAQRLKEHRERLKYKALIIRKHGTYAWGRSVLEAKRHLEALDYLCECAWKLKH